MNPHGSLFRQGKSLQEGNTCLTKVGWVRWKSTWEVGIWEDKFLLITCGCYTVCVLLSQSHLERLGKRFFMPRILRNSSPKQAEPKCCQKSKTAAGPSFCLFVGLFCTAQRRQRPPDAGRRYYHMVRMLIWILAAVPPSQLCFGKREIRFSVQPGEDKDPQVLSGDVLV